MRATLTILAVAGLALTSACTDSERARRAATFADQAADITCWTYGTETFTGRSTGKVEYDEGGRISFVDAANGRFTTVEGDCRIVYLAKGEGGTPAPMAATRPAMPQPGPGPG